MNEPLEAWERVFAELEARGKTVSWLARKLNCDVQRVFNWKQRGIPPRAYHEVASALGKSIDWVAGVETADTAPPSMSPMAAKIATEFDRIKDDQQQLAVFAYVIGIIARANDGPPAPPTMRPDKPPTAGQ